MALPLVFSMVISLVYNMVDTFFIARTGNTNLVAGVSLGAPMFTAMIALGDYFGLGWKFHVCKDYSDRGKMRMQNASVPFVFMEQLSAE